MTRPTIAFVDHPFHRRTRSSSFFIDLLSNDFDVHVFYLEPDPRALMREIADAGYRIAVCWQSEFCVPYFLRRGMRVVCVPMYDGIQNAPDWYWLPMRQARFINFCAQFHMRHRMLGIESLYAQYFGEPKNGVPQARFDDLRGFFWQRRPEQGLSYKFARDLIGNVASSLHIHNAPDTERAEDWQPDAACTVSHFSDDGNTYREALEQANVFVCPRKTEGIGHAMIDAMARGMCVIAHNEPTANEYVVDGLTGLLVDYGNPVPFRLARNKESEKGALTPMYAECLGRNARELYLRGSKRWEETRELIPFFIRTTPEPDLTARERGLAEAYLDICKYGRRDFSRYLHLLRGLRRRGLRGDEASTIHLGDRIEASVSRFPGVPPICRGVRRLMKVV